MRALITALVLTSAVCAAAEADTVDPTALEATLEKAERAFARAAEERDRTAFESFLTPDTVFATPHGNLRGPAAILEQWAGFFAADGPSISWEPERVAVTGDGGTGLSSGPYRIEAVGPDGKPLALAGTFFSVWRRDEDGAWKIVLDSGTEAEPVAD